MIWKYLLRIWGWVCLLAAALHGALTLYAAAVPYNIYQPGSTGLAEWLGTDLITAPASAARLAGFVDGGDEVVLVVGPEIVQVADLLL